MEKTLIQKPVENQGAAETKLNTENAASANAGDSPQAENKSSEEESDPAKPYIPKPAEDDYHAILRGVNK